MDRILPSRKNENEELVTIPSTNISDDDVAFKLSVALPGLDKNDVRIEVKDNYLSISANIEEAKEEKDRHWIRKEFVHTSFYRAFTLPKDADPEKTEARMKNGLLTLKIGKIKNPGSSRKISVG